MTVSPSTYLTPEEGRWKAPATAVNRIARAVTTHCSRSLIAAFALAIGVVVYSAFVSAQT
jgi:hypothetical protein